MEKQVWIVRFDDGCYGMPWVVAVAPTEDAANQWIDDRIRERKYGPTDEETVRVDRMYRKKYDGLGREGYAIEAVEWVGEPSRV